MTNLFIIVMEIVHKKYNSVYAYAQKTIVANTKQKKRAKICIQRSACDLHENKILRNSALKKFLSHP